MTAAARRPGPPPAPARDAEHGRLLSVFPCECGGTLTRYLGERNGAPHYTLVHRDGRGVEHERRRRYAVASALFRPRSDDEGNLRAELAQARTTIWLWDVCPASQLRIARPPAKGKGPRVTRETLQARITALSSLL